METVCHKTDKPGFPAMVNRPISPRMTLELSDEEAAALARHLRHAIDDARFPYAPRLDPLKAILAKLDPRAPQPEPLPPLKPGYGRVTGAGGGGGERVIVAR
jgi:hypothetical protein